MNFGNSAQKRRQCCLSEHERKKFRFKIQNFTKIEYLREQEIMRKRKTMNQRKIYDEDGERERRSNRWKEQERERQLKDITRKETGRMGGIST